MTPGFSEQPTVKLRRFISTWRSRRKSILKTGVLNMAKETLVPVSSSETTGPAAANGLKRPLFLKGLGVAGPALSAGSLLGALAESEAHAESPKNLPAGDAAILRF